MQREKVTAERLRELFDYDAEAGAFIRKTSRGNARAGTITRGTADTDGHLMMSVDKRLYRVHRLAVLWMTSAWPEGEVDHIDGVRTNNVWSNLRDVSHAVNMQNQRRPRSDNQVGILGVKRQREKFAASIKIDGRQTHLGTFDTAAEAHGAYVEAKRAHHPGWTL